MGGVLDLLDGLLLMVLRIGHGVVFINRLETCLGFSVRLGPGVG